MCFEGHWHDSSDVKGTPVSLAMIRTTCDADEDPRCCKCATVVHDLSALATSAGISTSWRSSPSPSPSSLAFNAEGSVFLVIRLRVLRGSSVNIELEDLGKLARQKSELNTKNHNMNWTGGLAAQITKLLTCGLIYKMDWDVTQVTRTIETFKKCRSLIATQHNYFLIFNQLLTLTRNVSEAVGTANRSKMRQTYIERNMATPGWWPQLDQRATKQLRQKQLEQTCAEQLYLRGSEWLGASWNVLERVWMDWHTLEWQKARRNYHRPPQLVDELVPCEAEVIDGVIVRFGDAAWKPVISHE